MATLEEVRASIHTRLAAALTDIRFKPEHPTGMLSTFPAMLVYVGGGTWAMEMGATGKLGLARVIVEIHVSTGKDLARSIEELQPYLESVPAALMAGLSAGTFTQRFTFGVIDYELLASVWNGVDTMMARFTINDVKVRNNVS